MRSVTCVSVLSSPSVMWTYSPGATPMYSPALRATVVACWHWSLVWGVQWVRTKGVHRSYDYEESTVCCTENVRQCAGVSVGMKKGCEK